ncbi:MAG: HEAT repeat domain-containing protein, partial [Vicinamibacterales bacterium]
MRKAQSIIRFDAHLVAEADTRDPLSPELAARLVDFARACKAAARAVSLYPAAHPAIGTTLGRLVVAADKATSNGPFAMQIQPASVFVGGAAMARPDPAIRELAELLHPHLIGGLKLNGGTDVETWRALLLLLARSTEETRSDGGIGKLWSRSGGPSIEIQEIDYAEVLRERAGTAALIEDVVAACMKGGARLELDDTTMRSLVALAADPAKLQELVAKLEEAAGGDPKSHAAAMVRLVRGIAEFLNQASPEELEPMFRRMATAAASGLGADAMLALLQERGSPGAMAGSIDVVGALVDRMDDKAIASFVAGSVIAGRGPSDRLAQAFEALVPDVDRKRTLLSIAEQQVEASPLGQEANFDELWSNVENMLTSYTDESYVPSDYARELSGSRGRAVDVEKTADDPPERVAGWVATVSDAAIRGLDAQLLQDLLTIEQDPARWRDIAETVVAYIDDMARIGQLDTAWLFAEQLSREAAGVSKRREQATQAMAKLARGNLVRQAMKDLRTADDQSFARTMRLCHTIGPSTIHTLADVLSSEQDPKARRRIREILVGFGTRGREAAQQLLNAPNWEVRRTAAYLLSEFGGAEAASLEPLLKDSEPRVQREAVRAVMLNGSEAAFDILVKMLTSVPASQREPLVSELTAMRDDRSAPLFRYLLPRIDRKVFKALYLAAIERLGAIGGTDSVDALAHALLQGGWWPPFQDRTHQPA